MPPQSSPAPSPTAEPSAVTDDIYTAPLADKPVLTEDEPFAPEPPEDYDQADYKALKEAQDVPLADQAVMDDALDTPKEEPDVEPDEKSADPDPEPTPEPTERDTILGRLYRNVRVFQTKPNAKFLEQLIKPHDPEFVLAQVHEACRFFFHHQKGERVRVHDVRLVTIHGKPCLQILFRGFGINSIVRKDKRFSKLTGLLPGEYA